MSRRELWDDLCRRRGNAPKHRDAALRVRAGTVTGQDMPSAGSAGGAGTTTPGRQSPELVFKVMRWTKGAGGARRTGAYVGRADAEGRLAQPLETETGRDLTTRAELDQELASWKLTPNHENRSKKWLEATPEERKEMPEKEALNRRQSVHMVVSLPKTHFAHAEDLRDAVREHLIDTLGDAGHRYHFTLHTDEARPHVHIVAQVRSMTDREGRTRQLHFNPADCDAIRVDIARRLKERGVDIAVTRRADRPELRPEIDVGRAPLADRKTMAQVRAPKPTLLEKTAPDWYAKHGAELERRRADPAHRPPEPAPAPKPGPLARLNPFGARAPAPAAGPPPLVDPAAPAPDAPRATVTAHHATMRLNAFARSVYGDGAAPAVASFRDLYAEHPKMAIWRLNNRPETFGPVTGKAAQPFTGRGLHTGAKPSRTAGPSAAPTRTKELRQTADAAVATRRHLHDKRKLAAGEKSLCRVFERDMPWTSAEAVDKLEGYHRVPTPARRGQVRNWEQEQRAGAPSPAPPSHSRPAWEQRAPGVPPSAAPRSRPSWEAAKRDEPGTMEPGRRAHLKDWERPAHDKAAASPQQDQQHKKDQKTKKDRTRQRERDDRGRGR